MILSSTSCIMMNNAMATASFHHSSLPTPSGMNHKPTSLSIMHSLFFISDYPSSLSMFNHHHHHHQPHPHRPHPHPHPHLHPHPHPHHHHHHNLHHTSAAKLPPASIIWLLLTIGRITWITTRCSSHWAIALRTSLTSTLAATIPGS